jgi:hypothetical protein
MPYYYSTPTFSNSNGSASTNSFTMNMVSIAGLRAAVQKLIGGTFVTPADNAVLLRLYNSTTLLTAGSAIVPQPMAAGAGATAAIASQAVPTTVPTIGAGVLATVPKIQLAFNQRGTNMWAAFNADESIGFQGAVAPNAELILVNQSTGTSVPIYTNLIHSE